MQTRYAPRPTSPQCFFQTCPCHLLAHLHPFFPGFLSPFTSRLTWYLFCTLFSSLPIYHHCYVSSHLYHSFLKHFFFLFKVWLHTHRTPPCYHTYIDFQVHLPVIIDSFHYLVVFIRMRCLRKVNILNRTDYKLMCCLLGYVATETRVGKNRRLARDPCFLF